MFDTKRGALLLCSAVGASLVLAGMTPAGADSAHGTGSAHRVESGDNIGELISIPAGESTAATYARVTRRAAEINARTTADKKFTGVWSAPQGFELSQGPTGAHDGKRQTQGHGRHRPEPHRPERPA
ncbi:hypothetical protein AB0M61_39550 [Streptomyces sp. NPDC051642]|uniref:hypothetical protein n=1 Tax=Streptomyces sp. NPDC051642 TaxID=3154646 RepID=UPI00343861CF